MTNVVKVAISLPEELLEAADHERAALGESRSGLFRRALEHFLRTESEGEKVKRWIEGYTRFPEEEDEDLAWVPEYGIKALAEFYKDEEG